jgi:hypothetical protein
MDIPIKSQQQIRNLLANGGVTKDSYDMPILLGSIMHFLLDDIVGGARKISCDIALWETFIKIVKTEESIPLVDKKKTLLIRLDNRFTLEPAITESESTRLITLGFPKEEIVSLIASVEQEIQIEHHNADARGEKYVRPPFFPLTWNDQRVQYIKTPLDKTTGDIWSISIPIPYEMAPELHSGHFITALKQLISEMPLDKKTKKVVYAYSITHNVKLNVFITFK